MKVVGVIDGFGKTTCPRCHRESLGVCDQCRQIATMIVESCAMNLAMMPPEAFEDTKSNAEVVKAVEAARRAFYDSGISADTIKKLHETIISDVRDGLQSLDQRRKES